MAAIEIMRRDLDAAGLRREAARSRDADAARRMLALALVLEGKSRKEAAESCGMDRQTLRDWVIRYNAGGLAGLSDRKGAVGPKRRLSPEQEAEVAGWMRRGPDVAVDGVRPKGGQTDVVRWRCVDIQARIAREWGVALHKRSVGKLLHRLRFARVSTLPRHPKADAAAQASFGPGLPPL